MYLIQEAMGHERPDEGALPGATGGASWRGVQRACHSASKASRVQMCRRNGRPVFKEYRRPCGVKNSNRSGKPDFGAFEATTSSTMPSGVINDCAYSRMAVSASAHTTSWLRYTVACSDRVLQCGEDTDHWASRWPTGSSHRLAAPVRRTNDAESSAITSRPWSGAVRALMLVAPKKKQQSGGLYKHRYAWGTNTKASSNKAPPIANEAH